MDAVEFLKKKRRMCSGGNCDRCSLRDGNNGTDYGCRTFVEKYPEAAVAVVEKWSAEHPAKTRQSEFLKMFPDARINSDGVIDIDPCCLNEKLKHECDNKYDSCDDCHKDYWLSEVK